jgi:arsenite methyltransferase
LFDDRERALAESARVLVDGGRLMISDLYARNPDAIARESCASRILVRDELEASLSNAGFAMNVWEDHSQALRECAARFLFEHGTLDGLWGCGGGESSQAIQAEMRDARAGYFLLIATRRKRQAGTGGGSDER